MFLHRQESELRPHSPSSKHTWFGIFCCSMWLSVFCAASTWAAAELDIPRPTDPLIPAPPPPAVEASVVNLEVRLTAEGLAAAVDEGFPQVAARENDWSEAVTLGEREDILVLVSRRQRIVSIPYGS